MGWRDFGLKRFLAPNGATRKTESEKSARIKMQGVRKKFGRAAEGKFGRKLLCVLTTGEYWAHTGLESATAGARLGANDSRQKEPVIKNTDVRKEFGRGAEGKCGRKWN